MLHAGSWSGGDGEGAANTVPLSAFRQDLEKWKPAMEEEYQAITETSGVVEKVNEDDLANIPGIEDAEYAPAKLAGYHDQGASWSASSSSGYLREYAHRRP